ncbi:MAG: alpha-1,2-fucosyltransferase [Gallionella sp.]|nr:alpha-1,2-fucosyltransferase [Gallionella sp.]
MIISNIIGGLGNQMFQYAAARALALRRGVPLYLDISGFASYGLHQGFELQRVFGCTTPIATAKDISGILGWQSQPAVRRVLTRPRFSMLRRPGFVVEPSFHYWLGINNVPTDCFLFGYWQSEKYFRDAEQAIRSEFTFAQSPSLRNKELADQIGQTDAISLHVRRGDYAQNAKTKAVYGLCSLEFYQSAIRYLAERVDRPSFFIFSDDPIWVRNNLKIDFPCCFVDHNQGKESYNDMRLMSLCKHHIIANSSFSWWGAWLNPQPEKVVIAPGRWFVNDNNVADLFPQDWVVL